MDVLQLPGTAGIRYTAAAVARELDVDADTVRDWLRRGLLRGTRDHEGMWRIRRCRIRRALRDCPEIAATVARARLRLLALRSG